MTLCLKLRTLDAMNSSGLWITGMTSSRELRVLIAMNSSGLWMT